MSDIRYFRWRTAIHKPVIWSIDQWWYVLLGVLWSMDQDRSSPWPKKHVEPAAAVSMGCRVQEPTCPDCRPCEHGSHG